MNNLEWYELATGIGRRTGSIVGDRQIDYFAGVELDASDADHVDKIDWSLEDLPDDCRSAIDELLERMPDMKPGRDLEIFKAAREIGWIEAMSKRTEWRNLEQRPSLQNARDSKKFGTTERDRDLKARYLALLGPLVDMLPGPCELNEDLPFRRQVADEFGMTLRRVNQILTEMNLRKSVPNQKR